MQIKSYLTHKNIYFFGLVMLAVGIPISSFLIGLSQFILLGNWIIEGRFTEKWNTIKSSKALWIYISFFLFCLIGMLWTTDYDYGLKDLRIKLPLLWLPVLFFTSPQVSRREYHLVFLFYAASVFTASMWSMIVYSGLTHIKVHDIRDISRFQSHIRFAIMIVIACMYLLFILLKKDTRHKLIYIALLTWFLVFLVILQSVTGIVIGSIVALITLYWVLLSKRSVVLKLAFASVVISSAGYLVYVIADEWEKVYQVNDERVDRLPGATASHHDYYHNKDLQLRENGNLIWIYIQESELKQEWNKRSQRPFDSLDVKGNVLRYTLLRYLASKGLPRDSAGLSKLSDIDIRNVENGIPNYLYAKTSLRTRIHELVWEIEQAKLGQNPTGHSLTMRLVFWQTAWHITRDQPLFGVGTGDVDKAFKDQYAKDKTVLEPRWQLRAHNQFLATMAGLGFVGLVILLVSFFSPLVFNKKNSLFFVLFMLIQFFSFFNEDTLESQAGVTICAFFTQFLFHHDKYNA